VDEHGVTQYSQTPPPGREARRVPLPALPQSAPARPETGDDGRRRDAGFQQRRRAKREAEPRGAAADRPRLASLRARKNAARPSDLARLVAARPAVQGRSTTFLADESGADVELMNNAELSEGIAQAEEARRRFCD
jgi:hypothetical protein